MSKVIGIIGLGLIGGSLAKAVKAYTNYSVLGYDKDEDTINDAIRQGVINAVLPGRLGECDFVLIALYPSDTVEFVVNNIKSFKCGTVIIDCSGVKSRVCSELTELASKNGLYFIGGHPMAGAPDSGFVNSSAELFKGASMILCPDRFTPVNALGESGNLFTALGFKEIVITAAEKHDRIIAYTSQLAHVVSNAYIKSGTAREHLGFSAGSFRDMTRVSRLNAAMWTELFLENRDNLIEEIETLTEKLGEYAAALRSGDAEELSTLILEGNKAKESLHENR